LLEMADNEAVGVFVPFQAFLRQHNNLTVLHCSYALIHIRPECKKIATKITPLTWPGQAGTKKD
jgi:hypothetical protein